uniref:Uncharacterized protein n=1 Tax=Ditylenchus dipsaci TaxID=166011 RepID=A0A915DA57_9BILA
MLQEARVLLNDENEKEGLTQYSNELKAPAIVKTLERDIQPTPAARLGLSDATLITVDEDYVVPSSDPATNSTPNSARTATESSPAPAKTAVPRELSNWAKVKKKVVSLFRRNRQKHG